MTLFETPALAGEQDVIEPGITEATLYRSLSTVVPHRPTLRPGETVVTEQVETVDGDRSVEWLLDFALIG
ncbi:MAG: hypothetical protein ACLQVK_05175 [Acidimicrobiales bacterium]